MNSNLLSYIIFTVVFLVLMSLGDVLLLRLKMQSEYSRKFVHISSGLLVCTFPYFFDSHWWVLAICASFFLLLQLSLRYNFLKGINDIGRKTHGSIVYPIAVYSCFMFYWLNTTGENSAYLFYIPILLLSIPDAAAAIVGINFPIKRYSDKPGAKSWGGTGAFFISALLLVFVPLYVNDIVTPTQALIAAFIIATSTALIEAISWKGLDNLFVPLGTCLCLYLILL